MLSLKHLWKKYCSLCITLMKITQYRETCLNWIFLGMYNLFGFDRHTCWPIHIVGESQKIGRLLEHQWWIKNITHKNLRFVGGFWFQLLYCLWKIIYSCIFTSKICFYVKISHMTVETVSVGETLAHEPFQRLKVMNWYD